MRFSMRGVAAVILLFLLNVTLVGSVLAVPIGDVAVSDQAFVRHDGGSDDAIQACGDDVDPLGGGNRQQNEPTVAINPSNPNVMTAGANEYCGAATFGDAWMGFYVSTDNGATWLNSLNPGYPLDTSAEGQASPIFGRAGGAGDPLMDWDNENRLFYGGISFNRTRPSNGDVIVSTWVYEPAAPLSMDYLRTVIVGKGTPSVAGRFNDKPSLRVDDWAGSPHEGNVYVAWTLFPGFGQDQILFSRSTDHGASFSKPIKISKGVASAQGSDIAVAPDGTIFVVWREFAFPAQGVDNAIIFVKSTDGGQTFSNPQTLRLIEPYDRQDQYVSGGFARDCGDGPFLCLSNFVFHRQATFPNAVVDAGGNVYVTWEEVAPVPDNGDTYRPDGQARAVVMKSTDGGATWSNSVPIDPQASGHQWWSNLEFDRATATLVAIYFDSRADPFYSPTRPPGNQPNGTSACGVPAPQVCNVLNTFLATSTDGVAWSPTQVSTVGHQPEYEMFGARDVPFHGDYLWVDANGGTLFGVWVDNRDVVPGEDPREPVQDGFDVLQCLEAQPDGSFGPNTCPNSGGLNQNIYGGGLSLP